MKVSILFCAVVLAVARSSPLDDVANVNVEAVPEAPAPESIKNALQNEAEMTKDNEDSGADLDEPFNIYRNGVDNVLKGFLENLRKYFQKHEPIVIGELPIHEVHDDNINANLKATNVKIYKLSSFQVNKLKNSLFFMTEEFKVTFPVLEIHGDYTSEGTIGGDREQGKGTFEATVTNVVAWGKIYAKLRKGKVHIKKINLDYSFNELNTKVTGFKIEGKSDEEAEKILNKALIEYLTKNEKSISGIVANVAIEEGNKVLNKLTIKQLLQLLQHFKPKHPEEEQQEVVENEEATVCTQYCHSPFVFLPFNSACHCKFRHQRHSDVLLGAGSSRFSQQKKFLRREHLRALAGESYFNKNEFV